MVYLIIFISLKLKIHGPFDVGHLRSHIHLDFLVKLYLIVKYCLIYLTTIVIYDWDCDKHKKLTKFSFLHSKSGPFLKQLKKLPK